MPLFSSISAGSTSFTVHVPVIVSRQSEHQSAKNLSPSSKHVSLQIPFTLHDTWWARILPFVATSAAQWKLSKRSSTASRKGVRPNRTAVFAMEDPRGNEYMEDFDTLGKEIKGKAILVGWDPGPKGGKKEDVPPFSPKESLEELENLCKSINIEVKDRILQRWRPEHGRLPIGKGKAEELRQQVKYDPEIGVVVFDQDMSVKTLLTMKGRIAPYGECVIMDRTSLILRIFAARARTAEAKLQVKLASQRYMLPRLRYYLTTGAGMEARGGSAAGSSVSGSAGGAMKGKGETQLNLDRTLMHEKMGEVKKKLDGVRKLRAGLRARQAELGIPICSLVGYTNAGKSTLMNQLCKENEVYVKDRLFETLDPTRRRVVLEGGREVMLVDTVGFIQRLPEQLVMGFRATLEEVAEATVILHVVDISSETAAQQIGSVMETLDRISELKKDTPQIMVYNKIDKLEGGKSEELERSLSYPWPGVVGHVQISALNGIGLDALAEAIEAAILEHTAFGAFKLKLLIPYTMSGEYAKLKRPLSLAKITHEEHTNDGYLLDVTTSEDGARQLEKFQVISSSPSALSDD